MSSSSVLSSSGDDDAAAAVLHAFPAPLQNDRRRDRVSHTSSSSSLSLALSLSFLPSVSHAKTEGGRGASSLVPLIILRPKLPCITRSFPLLHVSSIRRPPDSFSRSVAACVPGKPESRCVCIHNHRAIVMTVSLSVSLAHLSCIQSRGETSSHSHSYLLRRRRQTGRRRSCCYCC